MSQFNFLMVQNQNIQGVKFNFQLSPKQQKLLEIKLNRPK